MPRLVLSDEAQGCLTVLRAVECLRSTAYAPLHRWLYIKQLMQHYYRCWVIDRLAKLLITCGGPHGGCRPSPAILKRQQQQAGAHTHESIENGTTRLAMTRILLLCSSCHSTQHDVQPPMLTPLHL